MKLGSVLVATLALCACSAETEAAEEEPATDAETYVEPADEDLGVPSQDDLDAAAAENIGADDLDSELEKLRNEMDEDG